MDDSDFSPRHFLAQFGVQACFLAAGFSQRFGSPKLLQVMPDGRCLIEHSLEPYFELEIPVCVFLRADDIELQQCLSALGIQCCLLENVSEGLSVSVKAAAAYIESSQSQFGIFALADMPFLNAQSLSKFLAEVDWQAEGIAAPFHPRCNRLGNPVLFHRGFLSEFKQLNGDQGAKPVIKQNLESLQRINCIDVGFYQDVDRTEDLLNRSGPDF